MGLFLLAGGGYYARKQYYAAKPAPIWIPLALRADISMTEQKSLAEQIDEKLRTDTILRQIVIDADLQKGFNQPTEDAAVKELDRRLFVKVGTADTPNGTVPSINVGVNGNGKEKEVLGKAAQRIIRDVWRMIGIDPDTGQPLQAPASPPPDTF